MTGKEIFHGPWSSSTIFQVLREPLGKCPSSKDSYKSSGCLEYDSRVFKTLWEMPFKLCSSVGDCLPIKMKYPFVDRDYGFTSGRLSKQVDLLGNEKDHKRIPSRPEDSISADARGRFLTQGWTWTTQGKYLQLNSCSQITSIKHGGYSSVLTSNGKTLGLILSTREEEEEDDGDGESGGRKEEKKQRQTCPCLIH